ncbi:MAG: hypothetical protein WAT79_14915 [Saprospiraceae bacterium]
METKSNFVLHTLHVIFWIIFIGLCINAGTLLVTFGLRFFWDTEGTRLMVLNPDLGHLFLENKNHYIGMMSFQIFITALKAYLAYLVLKIFADFNLERPFHHHMTSIITKISYTALEIAILSIIAEGYTKWLINRSVNIPAMEWGSQEFLFLAGIIYILSLVFKKGVDLQSDNELTV